MLTLSKILRLLLIISILLPVSFFSAPSEIVAFHRPIPSIPHVGIIEKVNFGEYQFTPGACPISIPPGSQEGIDIICGFVEVPSNYSDPQGPTLQLAVAIIKSLKNEPKQDPVFFAQGGPGGSTLKTYISPLLSANSRLRADRDIVLFDQRGTLYSRPSLYCDEYDEYVLENLDTDFPDEVYQRLRLEVMEACRNRLLTQDINLSDFDSVENAKDIEAIRIALGYEKINLYGVSYGTLLAQHYMRLFPNSLRSVIQDGVVVAERNAFLDNTANIDAAFRRLFESCSSDSDCQRYFPDLETTFFDLVAQLDSDPAQITLTHPDNGAKYPALMDGDSFIGSVFQMLYVSSLIPTLPVMIFLARKGNYSMLERILSIFIFDRSISYGMYYSVWCSEYPEIDPQQIELSGVHPRIAQYMKNDLAYFLETCNLWKVESLEDVNTPVTSDIPTLLLSGEFDPVTPPQNAERVAQFLSLSYTVSFPSGAHGQALDNPCSDQIILLFLDNPQMEPDTTCLADYHKINFVTKKNVITIPSILKLLNLEGNAIIEFMLLVFSQLVLLSSFIIFPLAWAFRFSLSKPIAQTNRKEILREVDYFDNENSGLTQSGSMKRTNINDPDQPWIIRRASWIAIFNTFLQATFILAVAILLFQMISNNDNRLFFGIAGEGRIWFTLPLLSLLFSIAMIFISIFSWQKTGWSLGRRLYFGVLTIATLFSLAIFFRWELLFAFFT
jgi:pimeloyl-ACP methyl ester carboxylesterase